MSDQPIDPTGPQNLKAAFGMIKGLVKESRRSALKAARKNGKGRAPRSCCRCCGAGFDYAIIKLDSPVQADICSECKQMLAQGYTCFVSVNGYAFIKHPSIADLAGKIEPMSEENMSKLKEHKKKQDAPKEEAKQN